MVASESPGVVRPYSHRAAGTLVIRRNAGDSAAKCFSSFSWLAGRISLSSVRHRSGSQGRFAKSLSNQIKADCKYVHLLLFEANSTDVTFWL